MVEATCTHLSTRTAFPATWHCLTGRAIGEVLGLVCATALDWGNVASRSKLGIVERAAARKS
jgi:hypothetical protein